MNDDDERKLPLRYARRVSVRGLDEFGIPAPLLHEVGARLGHRGIEVWVKGGLLENWILLANAEAYYGWVRKSAVTRVRLRATGPQSRDICRELCALLDRGDPSSVLRAGFVEVKWTAHAGFLLIFVNRDAGCSENLFWRICEDAGQPACTWGDLGLGLDLINRCALCSVYCPDEAIASHLRSYLNASTKEASREVIIANQLGIHSRPAALLARVANRFDSDIIIEGKSRLDNDLVQW